MAIKAPSASISDYVTVLIDRIPGVQETGMRLSSTLHDFIRARPQLREAVDVLHGKQAGHPLHPILQIMPLGAWVMGSVADFLTVSRRSRYLEHTADSLITTGVVAAIPTAVTGLADYSGLRQEAIKVGTLHLTANLLALTLYSLSIVCRKNGARGVGVALSLAGLSVVGMAGYLGGDMSYRLQVGVNRNQPETMGEKPHWQRVFAEGELPVGATQAVTVGDKRLLIYRDQDGVYAMSNVCSHAAGPLNEGTFHGPCVECPWHQSVFDMRTGNVVHGPAVFSQPMYPVRIRDGQIEVGTVADPVKHAREQIDQVLTTESES